jgi:hypothetical protein
LAAPSSECSKLKNLIISGVVVLRNWCSTPKAVDSRFLEGDPMAEAWDHEQRGVIEAVNVLLVSFTRTAVAELRNRIAGYVGDAGIASGIRIATIDSTAWTLLNGYDVGTAAMFGGYEANIEQLANALRGGQDDLLEHLEKYEHVIIDEAQDILGIRADLIDAMLSRFSGECGVTVFADPCQAIYGFTGDDRESEAPEQVGLLQKLRRKGGFQNAVLSRIHRTSEPRLIKLLNLMRPAVIDCETGEKEKHQKFRELIDNSAPDLDLDRKTLVKKVKDRDELLVLYRTRAEALLTSSLLCSAEVHHRLRMSGLPTWLQPWIGIVFRDWTEPSMEYSEFRDRWTDRECGKHRGFSSMDEAWEHCLRFAGQHGRVKRDQLRRTLSRSRPPDEFTFVDHGFDGPTIGTIHASKGREADDVYLYLPNSLDSDDICWAEESRVLYVGATRAKKTIRVGVGGPSYSSLLEGSGRPYRCRRNDSSIQFEVGRAGDLDEASVVSKVLHEPKVVRGLQEVMGLLSTSFLEYEADSSAEFDWRYCLRWQLDGKVYKLGLFSDAFGRDVFQIARQIHRNSPREIRHINHVGTRTVVLPSDDPQCSTLVEPFNQTGIFLVPVLRAWTKTFPSRKRYR